jgi:hypothetical protein
MAEVIKLVSDHLEFIIKEGVPDLEYLDLIMFIWILFKIYPYFELSVMEWDQLRCLTGVNDCESIKKFNSKWKCIL